MTSEELFALANSGDVSIITYPNIMTFLDEQGNTPIHILASLGYSEALSLYDINGTIIRNNNGNSIAHCLGFSGSLASLELLNITNITNDVNPIDLNNPVLCLASKGYVETIPFYDVNNIVRNIYGISIAHYLAMCGKIEVLNIQNVLTDIIPGCPKSILHCLAFNGKKEVLNYPPNCFTDSDCNGDKPLHYLSSYFNETEMLSISEISTITNLSGDTTLHHMAYRRRIFVLNHPDTGIVKNNSYGDTPLHILAKLGVQQILSHPNAYNVFNNSNRYPASYLGY